MIHSRSENEEEILRFVAAWDEPAPIVLVPTTYHGLRDSDMRRTGKVRMVIYANHGLRAAIAAVKRVFRQILDDGTTCAAEEWIAPLQEVFELQEWHRGGAGE